MNRREKLRPAPGGCSIGHCQITAGTLGCWVKKDGQWLALSNNHVLANCNKGKIGDSILQPGKAEQLGENEIGKLHKFIPLSFTETNGTLGLPTKIFNLIFKLLKQQTRLLAYKLGKPNIVDCALAKPNDDNYVLPVILQDNDSHIIVTEDVEPQLGMEVKKSGRTTGTTFGVIMQTDVAVNVNMGEGRTALFTGQFVIEGVSKMSAGGDSGSLITTYDDKAVGLLFAGGENHTIANPIWAVKNKLGFEWG